MPLTDVKVKSSRPRERPFKLFDGGGLYLYVTPTGSKVWRLKYRVGGKEKLLSFGAYPEISLAKARAKQAEARQLIADGTDPGEARKTDQVEVLAATVHTFEYVAREWHAKLSTIWTPGHASTLLSRLQRDVFPFVGATPIKDMLAPDLLTVLHRIESRGALETAHRVKTLCGQVLRYAVATGRADRDFSVDLKDALVPVDKGHHAAITDPVEVGGLLRAIDDYQGSFVTRCALRMAALTFVRPGELRKAEWREIGLETAEWNIPAQKMKMKQPHLVPLSRQAVDILVELQGLTGRGLYVFPCERSVKRPMSDNAILAALRRMGYTKAQMSGHGFRAMARTILDEVLHIRPDFIEHQLAHAVKDPNGRAYNRTTHLSGRRKMMQRWADYLDQLRDGAKVSPLRGV